MIAEFSDIDVALVISDTHCGSRVALHPPEVKLDSGNTVGIGDNLWQKWLWQEWERLLDDAFARIKNRRFVLVLNGDMVEGIHHRNAEITATKIEEHAAIAVQALHPVAIRAAYTLMTLGTECHTKDIEHYIAQKLNALTHRAEGKWRFRINDCLCDATHHMPATSRTYLEASAYAITMNNASMSDLRDGVEPAKVFFRGHRHVGGVFSDGRRKMAVTGGWQAHTRFTRKVVPDALPCPSVVVADWAGTSPGSLPELFEYAAKLPKETSTRYP